MGRVKANSTYKSGLKGASTCISIKSTRCQCCFIVSYLRGPPTSMQEQGCPVTKFTLPFLEDFVYTEQKILQSKQYII